MSQENVVRGVRYHLASERRASQRRSLTSDSSCGSPPLTASSRRVDAAAAASLGFGG